MTQLDDARGSAPVAHRRASDVRSDVDPAVPAAAPVVGPAWRGNQTWILLVADMLALTVAFAAGFSFWSGIADPMINQNSYLVFTIAVIAIWIALIALARCYEVRFLGVGTEEFKRLTTASFQAFAAITMVSYIFKLSISRGFVAIVVPVAFVLLLIERLCLRFELQQARRTGRALHRVLIVGDRRRVAELATQFRTDQRAGFAVVGACLPEAGDKMRDADEIPVFGTVGNVVAAVEACGADTVAITAGSNIHAEVVREISWALEGMDVDLVVAPAITDVAGPRIMMRPVAGLPLLYLEEPEFRGYRRVVKRSVDLVISTTALVLLSPVLLAVAIAIKIAAPGPVMFVQNRVGRDGSLFRIYKFRSMRVGAEAEQAAVWAQAAAAGADNNKAKDDPRIFPLGKFLRRWSIDELPQLLNVVNGSMSLVGPRPIQSAELDEMPAPHRRRHLLKPGLTGLWQVSGRSETTWDERMRMDLYYVENWSLSADFAILLRTLTAVVRGSGAY